MKNSVVNNNYTSLIRNGHGVLFQNSDGNINLGVWFNDPDVEMYDIIWYNVLASEMYKSLYLNEGFISVDKKFETASCYVELHRKF